MRNALVFYPDLKGEALNCFRQIYDPIYIAFKEQMPLLITIPDALGNDRLYKHPPAALDIQSLFDTHLHGLFKSWYFWLSLGAKETNDQVRVPHEEIYSVIPETCQPGDPPLAPHIGQGLIAVKIYNPFSTIWKGLNEEKYRIALHQAKFLNFDFRCKVELLDLLSGRNEFYTAPVTMHKYSLL